MIYRTNYKHIKGDLLVLYKVLFLLFLTGAQFEGDLGEILALGAEISPYIVLRKKLESP